MKRRSVLRWPAALLGGASLGPLAGCAQFSPGGDRLIDLRSGRDIGVDDLLRQARLCRFLLLGEQHDNPHHHARRADLMRQLAGSGAVVVAEHLTRGRRVPAEGDLLAALESGGFEPRNWQWPLHQPLFAALREANLPLWGGNLPTAQARRIAREGEVALPAELAGLLAAAPLPDDAQARLDADLVAGHCGQLHAARLPAMRLAQRARDAAMALALQDSGGRPAVLLAGNGHVRSDYGVPRLLLARDPAAPVISVVFGEPDSEPRETRATHLWLTPAVPREDPCLALGSKRRPAPPERAPAR